jgi:hypothetical protein
MGTVPYFHSEEKRLRCSCQWFGHVAAWGKWSYSAAAQPIPAVGSAWMQSDAERFIKIIKIAWRFACCQRRQTYSKAQKHVRCSHHVFERAPQRIMRWRQRIILPGCFGTCRTTGRSGSETTGWQYQESVICYSMLFPSPRNGMMILLKLVIVLHWGGSTKILVWSISPLPLNTAQKTRSDWFNPPWIHRVDGLIMLKIDSWIMLDPIHPTFSHHESHEFHKYQWLTAESFCRQCRLTTPMLAPV